MPKNYLTEIIERKKQEVALLPPVVRFKDALRGKELAVIAEIKRRSPSKGALNETLQPEALAQKYVAGGAAALSVLTDGVGFGGSLDDLKKVIAACPGVPVLRKDFIIDIRQLDETARAGAHAVLLIAAVLKDRLGEFIRAAKSFGLDALVEVHDAEQLRLAQEARAEIIGVNNRNLSTFELDLATALSLAPHISASVVRVAESGIENTETSREMRQAGYDAVLVGEALVRAEDPQSLIEEMRHAH